MVRSKISAAVYNGKIKGAHSDQQNDQVIQYMREIGQPHTIRMLYRIMNARGYEIDLVSLRRAVTNLSKQTPAKKWMNRWDKQILRIAFERECPITKVTVGWYELVPVTAQFGLFPETKQQAAA